MIVALLWLWITNLALLFGAELDAELERGRQLQAGIAAEEELQLPARDTRNIKKAHKKQEKDIALGRKIRRQAAAAGADKAEPEAPRRRNHEMKKLPADCRRHRLRPRAKAGRERYEQIRGTFNKVKDDPRVQEKAHQAADFAAEKAPVVKDKVTEAAGAAAAKAKAATSFRRTPGDLLTRTG